MVTQVSAVVITRNEQQNIASCLARLKWADEVVVFDSFSTDQTVEVAGAAGANVHQRDFDSFPKQRNAALAIARNEWVFFVDADEWVTSELQQEVRTITSETPQRLAGFWVPRRNIIWGRWIRHAGWYPDYQLRLLRRGRVRYDESREVHELVNLDGEAGYLREPLVHNNYRTVRQFLAKQRQYSGLEARSLYLAGVRPRARNYVLQPLREIRRRLFQLHGYRDGVHGLALALLLGYYTGATYVRLARIWRNHGVQCARK